MNGHAFLISVSDDRAMRGCLARPSVDNTLATVFTIAHSPSHHRTTMSVRKSAQGTSTAMLKRARVDDEDETDPSMTTMTISSSGGQGVGKNALVKTVKRTSGLSAPIVSLAGAHQVSKSRFWEGYVRDAGVAVAVAVMNEWMSWKEVVRRQRLRLAPPWEGSSD